MAFFAIHMTQREEHSIFKKRKEPNIQLHFRLKLSLNIRFSLLGIFEFLFSNEWIFSICYKE